MLLEKDLLAYCILLGVSFSGTDFVFEPIYNLTDTPIKFFEVPGPQKQIFDSSEHTTFRYSVIIRYSLAV